MPRALAFLGANHAEADRLAATEAFRDYLCLCASILLAGLPAASDCIRRRSAGASATDTRKKIVGQLAPLFGADPSSVLIEWAQVQPAARADIAPCKETMCDVPWVNSPARRAALEAERAAQSPVEESTSLGLGSSLAAVISEGEDPEENRRRTIRAWQQAKRSAKQLE